LPSALRPLLPELLPVAVSASAALLRGLHAAASQEPKIRLTPLLLRVCF